MTAKKKTPKATPNDQGELPYTGRSDPAMYERLSRPWPSVKAADAAILAFFEEAHALRIKHGIRDVTVITTVAVNHDGQTVTALAHHHSGDSREMLPMVAATFRDLRARDRDAWLRMAGLLSEPEIRVQVVESAETPASATRGEVAADVAEIRMRLGRLFSQQVTASDVPQTEEARRDEQRLCLAMLAHGDDPDENARVRIRERLAAVARLSAVDAPLWLAASLRRAEASLQRGLWGDSVFWLEVAEKGLVSHGHAEWRTMDTIGGWEVAPAPAPSPRGDDRARCERELKGASEPDVKPADFDPAMAREEDLSRTRRRLLEAGERVRAAQQGGDDTAAQDARRDEQRLCLAILAYGPDQEAGAARQRIRERIDVAEGLARQEPHKEVWMLTVVHAARGAANKWLWGEAVQSLELVERVLIDSGRARWVPYAGLGGWEVALVPTPKEKDRARCETAMTEAERRAKETRDVGRYSPAEDDREAYNNRLALQLHGGDQGARGVVRQRLALLSQYLMLRGGTDFLNDCRAAVAEERWGDLVHRVAGLEEDFVRDKTLRFRQGEQNQWWTESTGTTSPCPISTEIDAGEVSL